MNDSPYAPRSNAVPPEGMVRAAPPAYPAPYAPTPYPAYGAPAYGGGYGAESGMDAGSGVAGLRRVWAMLWRRRLIIVATMITVVAASWFFGRRQIALYQSQASMTVSTTTRVATNDPGDPTGGVDKLTQQVGTRSIETQLAVLNSQEILEAAQTALFTKYYKSALAKNGKDAAAKQFAAERVSGVRSVSGAAHEGTEDIIDINVIATNPQTAQDMAATARTVYINHTLNTNQAQYKDAIKFADWQRQNVSKKLDNATRRLSNFQRTNHILTASTSSEVASGAASLQDQLDGVVRDSREANAKLDNARTQIAGIKPFTYEGTSIVTPPEADALRKRLIDLNQQRAEKIQEYQPGSPIIQALDAEIADVERQQAATPKTESGGLVRVNNPIWGALNSQISQLENQLRALSARESTLRSQLATASAKVAQLPGLMQQLSSLQGEVNNLSGDYTAISTRYNNLRANLSVVTADVVPLFSNASAAVSLAGSSKRNMIIAAVMGLILALALAALVDWMDDRVHSEEDAKNALQLPVLAQVPYARDGAPTLSSTQNAALPSPGLENFRMLRTLVAFSPLQTPARSVMLTSSLPGEGKSVCASNLAIAAALSGESVILVDGDLRRPTQHEIFKTSNEVGFSSVANGYCTLKEALQETNTPGLRLLPGGPVEANPFTLLNGPRGRQALREAGELADLVIIDSPPALLFADAQLLASEADAVLLVVSSRDVGKREIARTRALLAQTGTRPVGIVLNKLGAEAESYDKYAAKYYGRYKRPLETTSEEQAMMQPLARTRPAVARPATPSRTVKPAEEGVTVAVTSTTAVLERPEESEREEVPRAFSVVVPEPVSQKSPDIDADAVADLTPANGQNHATDSTAESQPTPQSTTPFDGARFASLRNGQDNQAAGQNLAEGERTGARAPRGEERNGRDENGRSEIGRGDAARPARREDGVYDSRYDGRGDGPSRN